MSSWARHQPPNNPDGSLNSCIQCDEDLSGPNFKVTSIIFAESDLLEKHERYSIKFQYFSGRTRRNSGIPSSIHRPDAQNYPMQHCYWYGDLEED